MNIRRLIIALFLLLTFVGCRKESPRTTPWGTSMDGHVETEGGLQLTDLQVNGEMIVLTVSGPDTYYDYHGRGAGLQYLVCERFANLIGVTLRVELCRDTLEVLTKLAAGEGDVAVLQLEQESPLCQQFSQDIRFCGMRQGEQSQWAVGATNTSLADTLTAWYNDQVLAEVKNELKTITTSVVVQRQAYSPMKDAARGIISPYDDYFRRYAPVAGFDWRLLAAQCYQESAFNARAVSWAGACGLMQIMPSTARHLGMSEADLWNGERNIEGSVRYIKELSQQFSDIVSASERRKFVLAAYNGGYHHIRDAMALASKYGANAHKWSDVKSYVLRLSQRQYFNDPVVKSGYMRGEETAGYVDAILSRWEAYKNKVKGPSISGNGDATVPRPAKHSHRFNV